MKNRHLTANERKKQRSNVMYLSKCPPRLMTHHQNAIANKYQTDCGKFRHDCDYREISHPQVRFSHEYQQLLQ